MIPSEFKIVDPSSSDPSSSDPPYKVLFVFNNVPPVYEVGHSFYPPNPVIQELRDGGMRDIIDSISAVQSGDYVFISMSVQFLRKNYHNLEEGLFPVLAIDLSSHGRHGPSGSSNLKYKLVGYRGGTLSSSGTYFPTNFDLDDVSVAPDYIPEYAVSPYRRPSKSVTVTLDDSDVDASSGDATLDSLYTLTFSELVPFLSTGSFIYLDAFTDNFQNGVHLGNYFLLVSFDNAGDLNNPTPKYRAISCQVLTGYFDKASVRPMAPAMFVSTEKAKATTSRKFYSFKYSVFSHWVDGHRGGVDSTGRSDGYLSFSNVKGPDNIFVHSERLFMSSGDRLFGSAVTNPFLLTSQRFAFDTKRFKTIDNKDVTLTIGRPKSSGTYANDELITRYDGVIDIFNGDILETDPFNFVVSSTQSGTATLEIKFLADIGNLIIATSVGIYINQSQGLISPFNVQISKQAQVAADFLFIIIHNYIIFSANEGRSLYALNYKRDSGGFVVNEISFLDEDLYTESTIVRLAYSYFANVILVVMADGTVHGISFFLETGQIAYNTFTLPGEINDLVYDYSRKSFYILATRNFNIDKDLPGENHPILYTWDLEEFSKNDEDYLYFRFPLTRDPSDNSWFVDNRLNKYGTIRVGTKFDLVTQVAGRAGTDAESQAYPGKVVAIDQSVKSDIPDPYYIVFVLNPEYHEPQPDQVPKPGEIPQLKGSDPLPKCDSAWVGFFVKPMLCTIPLEIGDDDGDRLPAVKRLDKILVRYFNMKAMRVKELHSDTSEDLSLLEGTKGSSGLADVTIDNSSSPAQQICISGELPGPFYIQSINVRGAFYDG